MSNMTLANVVNNNYSNRAFNYFPPGFRFKPNDDELIHHYLRPKLLNLPLPANRIIDVDLYNYNPAKLVELHKSYGEGNWYCFTPRKKKYPNGTRPDRAAGDGYWKATGADKIIKSKDGVEIGRKKALVFYSGKALQAQKTEWMMHEYKLSDPPLLSNPSQDRMQLDDWILCKIYKNINASKKRTSALHNASKKRTSALPSANTGTEQLGLLPSSNGPTFDIISEVPSTTLNGLASDIGSERIEVPSTTLNGPASDIGSERIEVPSTTLNGPASDIGSERIEVPSTTLNGPTFYNASEWIQVPSTTWNGPASDIGSERIGVPSTTLNGSTFYNASEWIQVPSTTWNGPTFGIESEVPSTTTLNGPTFDIGSEHVSSTTLNGPSVDAAVSKEIEAVHGDDNSLSFLDDIFLPCDQYITQEDVELAVIP